jgi:hypothetical protein
MSDTKQVPVFIYEFMMENMTMTIHFRNNQWMADVIEAGRVMAKIKTTTNTNIRCFHVTENAVTFTGD